MEYKNRSPGIGLVFKDGLPAANNKEERKLIDAKFIGKKYEASDSYDICRMKIREYALSLGDFNPYYLDRKKAEADTGLVS